MPNNTFKLKRDLDRWQFRTEVKEEQALYYDRKSKRYEAALIVAVIGIVVMTLITML